MQSPELFLSGLNRALRDLRAAASVLKDEQLDEALLPIMRRLHVAEIVGTTWIIAIGGSQGAGKTTLVRTIYELDKMSDDWLAANEGLGEKLPVLIQETEGCSQPVGYLRKLSKGSGDDDHSEMVDTEAVPSEFQRAVKGEMPEVMLPILKVPRRLFNRDGQALMLLPGYEPVNKKNQIWQEMMRQVLISAAGSVIVTDPTRLANQQQREIVKDLLTNELRTVAPIVVVSKTESYAEQPDQLAHIRRTASEVFGVPEEARDGLVICSGVDKADYRDRWLPKVRSALGKLSAGSCETRQVQLARLETLLSRDLQRVLVKLHARADVYAQTGSEGDGAKTSSVRAILTTFDEEAETLRSKHHGEVEEVVSKYFGDASETLKSSLIADHEGLLNKLNYAFDSFTEKQSRIESDVFAAWESAGRILPRYVDAIGKVTSPMLRLRGTGPENQGQEVSQSANPLQQLGYVDAAGAAVTSKLTDDKVQANLAVLLGVQRSSEPPPERSNAELESTVRMLPAMALEYARLACLMPALVGVHPVRLDKNLPQMDLLESAKRVQGQFEQFREVSGALLKGISLMLAVDVAVDGQVNVIPALLSTLGLAGSGGEAATGGAAAAGSTVASAVAGVVAVGYIAHAALKEVQRHDGQVSAQAHAMLASIRDYHVVHFEAHFDDLIKQLRSHLVQRLRRRYGMDRRLMLQDRLTKALADVDALSYDLVEVLRRSGQTLQASGIDAA